MIDPYIRYLDFNFRVACRYCKARVLDPDKKNGQILLNDRCPKCGKHPEEEKHLVAMKDEDE